MMKVVQLPEAGEGVELVITNRDWRRLCNEIGADYQEKVPAGVEMLDFKMVDQVLAVAAKKDGAPVAVKIEDMDISLHELRDRILDAIGLSLSGKTWREHMKALFAKSREVRQDLEGELSPAASSPPSTGNSSTPVSAPPNSIL